MMLLEVHTILIRLPASPILYIILAFIVIFVAIRVVVRFIDLVGV